MTVKTTTYSAKELTRIFDDFPSAAIEGGLAHNVFSELKRRVENGIPISHTESFYLYIGVKYTFDGQYGKVEDYQECHKHIFTNLYLIYSPDNLSCQKIAFDAKGQEIPLEQRIEDENVLTSFLNEWERILSSKISDPIIKFIQEETNKDIKKLEPLSTVYGANYIKTQRRKIFLRARYAYYTVLERMDWSGEEIDISAITLKIKFKPKSLVHILYRHYGQIAKPIHIVNEDYFTEEIDYKKLGNILKVFLEEIYNSGLIAPSAKDVIRIKYKNTIYLIVIRNSNIITFYPVSQEDKLQRLKNDFDLHSVNDSLGLYLNPT